MSDLSIRPYFPFCRVRLTRQSVDPKFAWVEAEPDMRFHPVCAACGAPAKKTHQWNYRAVRDLNLGATTVTIKHRYRTVYCEKCHGYSVEDLGLCDPSSHLTRRMERYVYELCRFMSVKEVADHLGLDWKTVRAIDKAFLEERYGALDGDNLRILAVDEIAVRKGHKYMTVVLDFETGRVVWMGEGHSSETLAEFFGALTDTQKASIEAIAMDMWDPFVKAVRESVPHVKIVFDLFHVVQAFNKVIDRLRIDEYRKAAEQDKDVYKGSKYLLLKNPENLDDDADEPERLERLLEINETLSKAMILKDLLKELWDYERPSWAERALERWCNMAETIDHPDVRRFVKTLRKYAYGILNHCQYPIHTASSKASTTRSKSRNAKPTATATCATSL